MLDVLITDLVKSCRFRRETSAILTVLFFVFWYVVLIGFIFFNIKQWIINVLVFFYNGLYFDKLLNKSKRKNEFKWKNEILEIIDE